MEVLYSFEGVCSSRERGNLGDNSGGVTPVPIPNTEVKLYCAESTYASRVGRIGRCRISIKNARFSTKIGRFAMFLLILSALQFY